MAHLGGRMLSWVMGAQLEGRWLRQVVGSSVGMWWLSRVVGSSIGYWGLSWVEDGLSGRQMAQSDGGRFSWVVGARLGSGICWPQLGATTSPPQPDADTAGAVCIPQSLTCAPATLNSHGTPQKWPNTTPLLSLPSHLQPWLGKSPEKVCLPLFYNGKIYSLVSLGLAEESMFCALFFKLFPHLH